MKPGQESSPSDLRPGEEESRVRDIEMAEIGAYAEQPIRDLPRSEWGKEEISSEDKAALDRVAGKLGERAMQEYAAEKEKNPVERLVRRLEQIAEKMRQEGLDNDASIVELIPDRLQRYIQATRAQRDKLQKELNRRVSLGDLYQYVDYRPTDWLVITHRIGEDGGAIYWPAGHSSNWFGSAQNLEAHRSAVEEAKERGAEVVNFAFSEQGKTAFLRELGVLSEEEEALDLPTVWERILTESKGGQPPPGGIDPRHFRAIFPTHIAGVGLQVRQDLPRKYDGKNEEILALVFEENFMKKILDEN